MATGKNFGMKGPGRGYIFDVNGTLSFLDLPDAVFDCAWSEASSDILAVITGSGEVLLVQDQLPGPMVIWRIKKHVKEGSSVDWNILDKRMLVSASWDGHVHCWNIQGGKSVLADIDCNAMVHQASWSPHFGDSLLTVHGDQTAAIWDISQGTSVPALRLNLGGEALTADWCKYGGGERILTAGTDNCIKIWDLRHPEQPVHVLRGHRRAIRKARWSPWHPDKLASVGYDMSLRVWDLSKSTSQPISVDEHWTEFTMGLDWALHERDLLAVVSWDEHVELINTAN